MYSVTTLCLQGFAAIYWANFGQKNLYSGFLIASKLSTQLLPKAWVLVVNITFLPLFSQYFVYLNTIYNLIF